MLHLDSEHIQNMRSGTSLAAQHGERGPSGPVLREEQNVQVTYVPPRLLDRSRTFKDVS